MAATKAKALPQKCMEKPKCFTKIEKKKQKRKSYFNNVSGAASVKERRRAHTLGILYQVIPKTPQEDTERNGRTMEGNIDSKREMRIM